MKIWLFIVGVILIAPVIAVLMLQLSGIQNSVRSVVERYISEKTGMETTVGKVGILLPFFAGIHDVKIMDHHDQRMLEMERMSLLITSFDFRTRVIRLEHLSLRKVYIHQQWYPDEPLDNLSLFAKRLGTEEDDQKEPSEPLTIRCDRLTIKDGTIKTTTLEPLKSTSGIDLNHLHLKKLFADISNIAIKGDLISLKINDLHFLEGSGFRLTSLSTLADITPSSIRLRSLNLSTNQTSLALDLSFHYRSFADFKDFENSVFIRAGIGVTSLSTYDLGFFIPEFYRTNNQINMKGAIEGFLNNFDAPGFQFSIGSSSFDGDVALKGLPDVENTRFVLNINHLVIDPEDIDQFHLNDHGVISSIPLPSEIRDLGMVSVNGYFDGTVRDFYTRASCAGSFGFVKADLQMAHQNQLFTVKGSLGIEQVDIGKIIRFEDLGNVTMDATIEGSGSSVSWDFDISGLVTSLDYRNYQYQNIDIEGKVIDKMFNGLVSIEDQNIMFDFNGALDFNGAIPSYNFVADIKNANLANLGFLPDTVRGLFSSRIAIDVQGDEPDNMAGLVSVDFAEFKTPTKNYLLNHFDLSAFTSPANRRKFIALRSDYLDGDIHGNFSFEEIGQVFARFASGVLPAMIPSHSVKEADSLPLPHDVHFDVVFKQTGNLTELITGSRVETERLQMTGSFVSADNALRISGKSDAISLKGQRIEQWTLNVNNTPEGVVVNTSARKLVLSDTIIIFDPFWESTISNNVLTNTLSWNFLDGNLNPDGIIRSRLNLSGYPDLNLTFQDGSILIKDTLWRIREGSSLSYMDNSLDINNFMFFSNGQSITVDGHATERTESAITCDFDNIDLSWIDFLTLPHKVDLDGVVSGKMNIRDLWGKPRVLADLALTEFSFNKDPLGSVRIISLWDDDVKGMKINADFIYQGNIGARKTAEVTGYLYPMGKDGENFDLTADFDNFRINLLSNFLSVITTDLKGFATGKLRLTGPFARPELTGKLKVNARSFLVDYLNTRYSFADTIAFTRDAIIFNHIQLMDNNRLNTRDLYSAVLNGSIGHRGFRDFSLNLSVKAENFTFLNTNGQQDPLYFGRALATGNVSITGPDDDILVTVHAKTERNTMLEIPLMLSSEVSRSSFITFIDRSNGEVEVPKQTRRVEQSNLRLDFNLQVTPDAVVRLVFDPLIGDVIEGSGSGNLLMNIDSKGAFELKGQYVIAKGDYIFNLENLISKKFSVRSGGTIRWSGDPYDANINIEAVYPTKASLAPLNPEDSSRTMQNVECVIHMTDKLFAPEIEFVIDFPDMPTFDKEQYQAIIKPNLNYHFLSLLAINRFVNTQSQQFIESGTTANIAGTNTTEMLANQLSVWLSNISDEFDVDFAYHPGTSLSTEQVEAAIKTQVLNDRLTIESKVGIGGKTYASSEAKTSNMVGDIVVEYKIDQEGKFRIKAFNVYNDQNILYQGAPYTQGVGVFYRKEFNSFRDLVKKRDKKKE